MNKLNIISISLIFLFSLLFFSSCQPKKDKKIIVENDSFRKVLEEQDSLKIIKRNPNNRN